MLNQELQAHLQRLASMRVELETSRCEDAPALLQTLDAVVELAAVLARIELSEETEPASVN